MCALLRRCLSRVQYKQKYYDNSNNNNKNIESDNDLGSDVLFEIILTAITLKMPETDGMSTLPLQSSCFT